jgi:hypothetical protein
MSQTLVPSSSSSEGATSHPVTWASPSSDLWVASLIDHDGVHFLGFVERSLGDYIAVDGSGASKGRHADLASARRALDDAFEPSSRAARRWSDTGAPVLTVRALRSR